MDYPKIKRVDHTEDYHGHKVLDPYFYLEDPENQESKKFVEENNRIVEDYMDQQLVEHFSQQLEEAMEYEKFFVPQYRNNRYFYGRQTPDDMQPMIYMREGIDGEENVIFDINAQSEDGTTASMIQSYSHDGKYMTAHLTKHGSDWQEILVKDIDQDSPMESLQWTTMGNIAWNSDSTGFYYTKYPDQTNLSAEEQRRDAKLYFHKLGTEQDEDIMIFNPEDKEEGPAGFTMKHGKYLMISLSNSTLPENRLLYREEPAGEWKWVIDEYDGSFYDPVGIANQKLYLRTSADAPNNRIVVVDLDNPQFDHAEEIISEQDNVLRDAILANDSLVLIYEENVKHVMKIHSLTGDYLHDIEFPNIGTLAAGQSYNNNVYGEQESKDLFFGYTSFLEPMDVYHYDLESKQRTKYLASGLDIDSNDVAIKQVFYNSKDGTRIPMYLISKNNIEKNGKNPTFLYGYGGFNISILPSYSPQLYTWVQEGGLYAIANLRGGGEYGKEWHEQALLANKQNVFDDFIAAAEYLITENYTSTPHLGINGRSNGGLLVGAVLTQRPDLFGATIPQVGVLDMLRFPVQKDAGRYWTGEYGDAKENEEHFDFLFKYSPYHNVKENTVYPPTLVTAAESDDRVAPMHSKKFGAALQYSQSGEAPILVRIETKAGHGYGKPKSKIIEDTAYNLAFLKMNIF